MVIPQICHFAFKRSLQIFKGFSILPMQLRLWKVLLQARKCGIITSPWDLSGGRPIAYKHLGCYLAKPLSASQRLTALCHTYSFLRELHARSLAVRLCSPERVWQLEDGASDLALWIGPPLLAPMEGEAALAFTSSDQVLFTMSFSIVPGHLVGVPDTDALMIGGLQGTPGCREEVREACRKLHEVAPQDLLIIAAKALASVLGIEVIAGLASDIQVAWESSKAEWYFKYEEFWERLGAIRNPAGFFLFSPDSIEANPMVASKSHRSRTRRKRRVRLQLQEDLCANFRSCLSAWSREGKKFERAPAFVLRSDISHDAPRIVKPMVGVALLERRSPVPSH